MEILFAVFMLAKLVWPVVSFLILVVLAMAFAGFITRTIFPDLP
jgi:hypothetical protein